MQIDKQRFKGIEGFEAEYKAIETRFFNLISRVNSLIEKAERIVGDVPLPESGTQQELGEKQKQLNALLAQKREL